MFISSRPRHSQSQCLVERGNQTMERKIVSMKQDKNLEEEKMGYPWASRLPFIRWLEGDH